MIFFHFFKITFEISTSKQLENIKKLFKFTKNYFFMLKKNNPTHNESGVNLIYEIPPNLDLKRTTVW
jgi:hypothetical protein